jgi:hypothetical protein
MESKSCSPRGAGPEGSSVQNVMGTLFIKDGGELTIETEVWARCMVSGTGFRDAVKAVFFACGMELMDFDGAMAQPKSDGKTHIRVWSRRFRTEQGG